MSVNVTEYESTLWHDGLRIRILHVCDTEVSKVRMMTEKGSEVYVKNILLQ